MLKQIMIPVAAFVVTTTGVSAFNTDVLDKIDVDLSEAQVTALEEAHELREAGVEREEVKTFLNDAGVDEDTIKEIKTAVREVKKETKAAVQAAVEASDYDAFVADAPERLLEAVDSSENFALFVEAKELKEAGDREAAAEIMSELGIEKGEKKGKGGHRHGKRGGERTTSVE